MLLNGVEGEGGKLDSQIAARNQWFSSPVFLPVLLDG